MEACRLMLELNGHAMRVDFEVVEMAIRVATHEVDFAGFILWLEDRTTPMASQPPE